MTKGEFSKRDVYVLFLNISFIVKIILPTVSLTLLFHVYIIIYITQTSQHEGLIFFLSTEANYLEHL